MEFLQQYWIYGLGFFAQALFGARLMIQWFHAERAGKVVSPTIFWQISLIASFLFLLYGILRDDIVIIIGQTLSYFIYIRNLQLKNAWKEISVFVRFILLALPVVTFVYMILGPSHRLTDILEKSDWSHPLLVLGALGQLMLNFRFIYQWYYSEKAKTSVLPFGFWMISAVSSAAVILYAVYRKDPVLLVAQSMGMVVYLRNLYIHKRTNQGNYS